jgi:hypothetical protein
MTRRSTTLDYNATQTDLLNVVAGDLAIKNVVATIGDTRNGRTGKK